MLVRGFSTGAVLAMNLVVIAILSALVYFLSWAGPEFCYGLIVGYAWCYIQFRCWRFDMPTEPEGPHPPQQQQRSRDLARPD